MNESYERALNELSILKKTLNSEKTSHQNTLHQLQTTYQIIQEIKELLAIEQQKNKSLNQEIKQRNSQIGELSQDYESQIRQIKQLIERKDLQLKKYTQLKVTDYDMIRFRVISQVEAQHQEEIQLMKNEIQKQQFLSNEVHFQLKVLKDKNQTLNQKIQEFKEHQKLKEEEISQRHNCEISKLLTLIEQEKNKYKQFEKSMALQKQKLNQSIKKYQKDIQKLQNELFSQSQAKQNTPRHSNLNRNSSSAIAQFKELELAQQNEKLRFKLKSKSEEIESATKKLKQQVRELNKKVEELEKELNKSNNTIKDYQADHKISKVRGQQSILDEERKQFERKEKQLKENYHLLLEQKEKAIQSLKKEIERLNSLNHQSNLQSQFFYDSKSEINRLQTENGNLQSQLNKNKIELNQLMSKNKNYEQNRQTRAVSVQNVKQKLNEANIQIVNLLRDKITLNEKIAKLSQNK